jgi:hypothetical protein
MLASRIKILHNSFPTFEEEEEVSKQIATISLSFACVYVCDFNFQQHHGDGQFGGDSNRGTDAIMGRVQRVLGGRTICDVARRCSASGNHAEGQ